MFLVFTVLSVTVCVFSKRAWDERRHQELQDDYKATRSRLENGSIALHQRVVDYLRVAQPCQIKHFGPYAQHDHGFVGGVGHGITVISKRNRLVKAYRWGCVSGDTYFDAMNDAEESEFDRLYIEAEYARHRR